MRWNGILGILGGLLWVCAGGVLALRPANVPGVSFRASMDVLPWLGLGLLLIAAMLYSPNYQQHQQTGKLGIWATLGIFTGATFYALGHVMRLFLKGVWEPAVPLGFLIFIFSLFLLAIGTFRARVYSKRSEFRFFLLQFVCCSSMTNLSRHGRQCHLD